ncbi:MAG TPA: hypothetical protein VGI31_05200 [Streptosporangiaceae bacterium]
MIVLLAAALIAAAVLLFVTLRIGRAHRSDRLASARRAAADASDARARAQRAQRYRYADDDASEALTSVMPAINLPLPTQPRDAPPAAAPAFRPAPPMLPAFELPRQQQRETFPPPPGPPPAGWPPAPSGWPPAPSGLPDEPQPQPQGLPAFPPSRPVSSPGLPAFPREQPEAPVQPVHQGRRAARGGDRAAEHPSRQGGRHRSAK